MPIFELFLMGLADRKRNRFQPLVQFLLRNISTRITLQEDSQLKESKMEVEFAIQEIQSYQYVYYEGTESHREEKIGIINAFSFSH
jgi:hypothetical protein